MRINETSTGINLTLYNNFYIRFDNGSREYYQALKEHFCDYVPGYIFMPRYKAGVWNGKISIFDSSTRCLPYGLLLDILKFHKKEFPDIELNVDPLIKQKFSGVENLPWKWDLKWEPRYYQEDIIKKMIQYRSCIVESCTRSGKSLSISYIFKHLIENGLSSKPLLVVPRVDLVMQFKNDMIDYGIDPELIGTVWAEDKEFDKTITISTWQSLQFIEERFKDELLSACSNAKEKKSAMKKFQDPFLVYDCVTIDECHKSGNDGKLHYILQKCKNADWRFGLTGTLPDDNLSLWNVKSYLGPVVCTYKTEELRKQGFIANCTINIISAKYKTKDFNGQEISKESIFKLSKRINIIKEIVKKAHDKPIVLLVDSIKKDGEFLEKALKQDIDFYDREIIFIRGSVKAKEREMWYEKCRKGEPVILIAMYQILQEGLTIPCLEYLVFASPCSSKIRVLQSIGRTLGIYYSKLNAKIYDIVDIAPKYQSGKKAGDVRQRHYISQKFDIKEIEI